MMKSVGKLFGLRRKSAPPKSRIDSKKTRVNPIDRMLDDSDEGSYGSTTSDSSESEYRTSDDEPGSSDSSYRARASDSDDSSETDEKSAVSRRQRKRSASATALNDDSSDSSSDVGGEPLRRVLQRKRLRLPEDSEDEALKKKKRDAEVKQAAAKRRERKNKLMELSKRRKSGTVRRRRRTMGSDEEEEAEKEEVKGDKPEEPSKADKSEDESSVEGKGSPLNSSDEEKLADSDSLKDFIVEEDEQKKEDEPVEDGEGKDKAFLSHLPRQFITGSQRTHFQVVVKALLINVLDSTFLKSLYGGERTKRYAQEMKSSLHHFDERLVLPRLENLKQRSRWKERYKERVECYPTLRVTEIRAHSKGCEACELHRTGRFSVRLSGQLYHNNSLQEDNFMPDDSQCFFVGSVCASRTEVYHALKHFKYHLFQGCRRALEAQKEGDEGDKDGEEDEPVKDTVNKVFAKLEEGGWISEQYEKFQEHLNSADFFQEEKLD
ncbi:coiled-coil domain-containing protein 82 [Triplophysa dalaica]|uniref:coiled-coil domain-containing protein 82 n=1 Tax=Triplophysa dalaica TaxID=1582913 RepID=UPI0024E02633|nr:coiled-coil domain-containing protein 82 [Triplophysa dalaica]